MFVQRLKEYTEYTPDREPILDTFGEVQQIWHPWRRRYDLFVRLVSHRRILMTILTNTCLFSQQRERNPYSDHNVRVSTGTGPLHPYPVRSGRLRILILAFPAS